MGSQVPTLERLCLVLRSRCSLLTPHIEVQRHVSCKAPLLTLSSFAGVVLESGYRIEGVHLIEPKPRWSRFFGKSYRQKPISAWVYCNKEGQESDRYENECRDEMKAGTCMNWDRCIG